MKIFYSLLITATLFAAADNVVMAQSSANCVFGDASGFAVLAHETITNISTVVDPTIVHGNIGVFPGSAITGYVEGDGIVKGITYCATGNSERTPPENAMKAANAAYTLLKGMTPTKTFGPVQDLANMTLKPGVYAFPSSAMITGASAISNGTLTLDDTNDPNGIFVFQIASTLVPATYTKVVMKSGGHDPNIYWVVGSSATISVGCQFEGNIIALTDIETNTHATTDGRLFALNASVTMQFNTVSPLFDTDKDGVPDCLDHYPYDAAKAFNNFVLPQTITFEDQWPSMGDFDMNDVVMTAGYNVITNSQNKVVEVIGTYSLIATGGINKNAFGIEFPIPATSIGKIVSGTLEPGQDLATFKLYDDMRQESMSWNTKPNTPSSPVQSYTVDFKVTDGPLLSAFGLSMYNPFIVNYSGTSRREVHLQGYMPTKLADKTVFGTGDDNSNLSNKITYVTKSGLPWALTMPVGTFSYASEGINITKAYKHMNAWANSGGSNFMDWYSPNNPLMGADYIDATMIYSAPKN